MDNYPDDKDNQQGLEGKGQAGDDVLGAIAPGLGQEVEDVAQQQEEGYTGVGGNPLHEHIGMEVGEDLHKDVAGNLKVAGTEKYPAGSDEMKGQKPRPEFSPE